MNDATNRRKSNRAYLRERKEVLVNGKRFILKDISREGIGVLVEDSLDFFIGQRIASIFLEDNKDAQPLVGIVNHLSQDVSGTICGIRFDFRSNGEFEYVEAINHALMAT
jgi:c-di-GMP-binding flagellar brake protein YcgR